MTQARQRAERRGRGAERIAAIWLTLKGYRVLGQRLRTPFGEVDIAALNKGAFVIIEVKARSTRDAGLYAVTPMQQERIARAASVLAGRWRLNALPIRFDVVVIGAGWPHHVRNAWDARLT